MPCGPIGTILAKKGGMQKQMADQARVYLMNMIIIYFNDRAAMSNREAMIHTCNHQATI